MSLLNTTIVIFSRKEKRALPVFATPLTVYQVEAMELPLVGPLVLLVLLVSLEEMARRESVGFRALWAK